jgi:hypothetical protein
METFRIPMRDIRKRFKKSELAVLAWRSSEMGYNMSTTRNKQHQRRDNDSYSDYTGVPPVHNDREIQALEERLGPVVHKMVNDKGEVDLGRLTGDEALLYMSALGIHIGGRVGPTNG